MPNSAIHRFHKEEVKEVSYVSTCVKCKKHFVALDGAALSLLNCLKHGVRIRFGYTGVSTTLKKLTY